MGWVQTRADTVIKGIRKHSVNVADRSAPFHSLVLPPLHLIAERSGLTPQRALMLFGLAVLSMGGFMFSQTLGIDDELNLFQSDAFWTWFRQGRFLIGAAQWLVPQSVTTLFPYLLLACAYVISHALLIACHGLRHTWRSDLAYLVFILFPTNWLSQEFVINIPGFALGLLSITLAALLTLHAVVLPMAASRRLLLGVLIAALLVVAIGGFQSLITLYLTIGTGLVLFRGPTCAWLHLANGSVIRPAKLLLWFSGLSVVAIVAHTALLRVFVSITHSQVHQIDRYFRSPYFMLRTQPYHYILGNIDQFLKTYLTPGYFYGYSLSAFSVLLFGFACLYIYSRRRGLLLSATSPRARAFESWIGLDGWPFWMAFLLLLIEPLLLNLVSSPYRIPMRALMALPYLAWLAVIFWLEISSRLPGRLLRWGGVCLSGLLVVQCLIATSNYYAARQFNFRSDQLVASSIVSAIINSDSTSDQRPAAPVRYLATSGSLSREVPYRTAWYSTAGSSFFNWDNGNAGRMVAWLRAMGIDDLKPLPVGSQQRFNGILESMSVWPQPGSIRVVDQVVLVHFGRIETQTSR